MTIDTECDITFENSIWLSQDVNHFIFLHQMITNYIKGEEDQGSEKIFYECYCYALFLIGA